MRITLWPLRGARRRKATGLILLGLLLSVGTLPRASSSARAEVQAQAGGTVGTPWTGGLGVRESAREIMARQEAHDRQPLPSPVEAERLRALRDRVTGRVPPERQPRARDADGQGVAPAIQRSLEPNAPQVPSTSFTGATLADGSAFPPDSMGAVGPTQFIVTVNNRFRSFNKASGAADGALDADPDVFFASVLDPGGAPVVFTSDPRVRFDRLSNRWFIVMINVYLDTMRNIVKNNRVLVAVSSGPSINAATDFTFFFWDQSVPTPARSGTCIADYPTLGIDVYALYIGVNVFCTPGETFAGTDGFVVRKASVLGAGPIVVTVFRGLVSTPSGAGPFTPQGVDNYDPFATEGYFIGVDNANFSILVIRRVSTPGGTPTISGNVNLAVSATQFPLLVPHQGNTGGADGQLDALDDRLFAAHLRNGRLWTAHNIGVDNTGNAAGTRTRNGSRWYEIQNLTTTPTLSQSGTVFTATGTNDTAQRHYWIPSIMVSGQGHAAMGFSTAGTNEYANAGTVGRLVGDPPGTMQTPLLYTSAAAAYNPARDPGGAEGRRWGDYSYTSLDPCDDMTMWTIQEFTSSADTWGVRVVKLLAPPPASPASASPASVPAGQSSVNVTITGTPANGSSFFDTPGAGIAACRTRIGATVTGGVTVNSITFNSPTSVTLNVSTVGATAGAKNLTIINPDGQQATGVGILTVSAPVADKGVGNGDPASCTETALNTALSGGGNVTFNCGAAPKTITLTSQKTISATTTIKGGSLITLSGGNATRLFFVDGGATLTLQNIVLSDGCTAAPNCTTDDGGAIDNRGSLVLTDSTIQNSVAGFSGGAIVTYGPLTITRSTLANNSALNAGAIYPRWGAAQVTIANSVLRDNQATGSSGNGLGGAMLLWDGPTVSIADSDLAGNLAAVQGGAISNPFANSSISLQRTQVRNNRNTSSSTSTSGAGIYNGGTATLTNITLSGNTGASSGGGIYNSGTATLANVTLSGNAGTLGGGIYNSATATLTNVTLSANSASSDGGGIANSSSVTLTNVTLSGNSAIRGGGIRDNLGVTTLRNVILADSPSGGNCSAAPGGVSFNATYSLVTDSSCTLTGTGNQVNTPAGLGPLVNNGGFTQTHLLQPGSAAIEGGTNAGCPPADQRGVPRPLGVTCDVGAVEVQPPPTRTPTPTLTPTRTVTPNPCAGNVGVTVAPNGAGGLQVSITARSGVLSRVQSVADTRVPDPNAQFFNVPGATPGATTLDARPGTTQFQFAVRPVSVGRAVTAPLVITDGCGGGWSTLVGGGPSVFSGSAAAPSEVVVTQLSAQGTSTATPTATATPGLPAR